MYHLTKQNSVTSWQGVCSCKRGTASRKLYAWYLEWNGYYWNLINLQPTYYLQNCFFLLQSYLNHCFTKLTTVAANLQKSLRSMWWTVSNLLREVYVFHRHQHGLSWRWQVIEYFFLIFILKMKIGHAACKSTILACSCYTLWCTIIPPPSVEVDYILLRIIQSRSR